MVCSTTDSPPGLQTQLSTTVPMLNSFEAVLERATGSTHLPTKSPNPCITASCKDKPTTPLRKSETSTGQCIQKRLYILHIFCMYIHNCAW